MKQIPGIHHVTAIAGDPQRNASFYTGLLGLRLVKRTVNFDDPGTYHLYYGDEAGGPGTILTFFPWPNAPRGRLGTGQATSVAFSIPAGAMDFWRERLAARGMADAAPGDRFGEPVLSFADPDGLQLELIGQARPAGVRPWAAGDIPAECAIQGFHSVTLSEVSAVPTASLVAEAMGFRQIGHEQSQGDRVRFQAEAGEPGALLDVVVAPTMAPGRVAVGSVHHVAWRTPSDAAQLAWRDELSRAGYRVTPVMDRQYFHSIYYREPGGVLFEIATDPPGFGLDEPPESLGTGLKLPPWLEGRRAEIERVLPPLTTGS